MCQNCSTLFERLFFLLLLPCLVVFPAGCNDSRSDDVVRIVADEVLEDLNSSGDAGDLSGIVRGTSSLDTIEVYVDLSLSMRPYVLTDENQFHRLLSTLGDFIASKISFHGFGFQTRTDSEQTILPMSVIELGRQANYRWANNDYASLIGLFDADGTTRLIVTDGVQSDPHTGEGLGQVVDQLHRFVSAGGTFAVFVYRTPYRGQYYSDMGHPNPVYDCDDRPLLVFVLAPSTRAVDDLAARLGSSMTPDHVVRISGDDMIVRVETETIPAENERRGLRVLRDVRTHYIEGYYPLLTAKVDMGSGREFDGFVPIQIQTEVDLTADPWRVLGPERAKRFLEEMNPEIVTWKVDERTIRRSFRNGDFMEESAELVSRVEKHKRDSGSPQLAQDENLISARYTVLARQPVQGHRHYAHMVRMRPSEANARALVPEEFSTDNDLSPTECPKILKLRQLVGAIMLRNYIPGQLLVVTDWR